VFEHVRIFDWDVVIYTVILSIPLALFTLPGVAMVYWGFRDGLGDVVFSTEVVAGILGYGLFLLVLGSGLCWAWRKTAFFSIEPTGDWVGRNAFWVPLWRIPPGQPRQIEGTFEESIDENGGGMRHYCTITVFQAAGPVATMVYMSDPLPEGRPDILRRLGYPDDPFSLPGPSGGRLTPWHTWSSSGPVFPADSLEAPTTGVGSRRDDDTLIGSGR